MNYLKKILASILVAALIVSNTPLQAVMAAEVREEVVSEENLNTANSEVLQVESIVCEELEIIEETNGWYKTEYPGPGQSVQYYYYNLYPTYTVTFTDGTVLKNQQHNCYYNGEYHSLNISNNQSYDNQWGVGSYSADVELDGVKTTLSVRIVESPIESVVVDELKVIENTCGHYSSAYDTESGEYKSYYRYDVYPTFTVKFKDGVELKNQSSSVTYNGKYYYVSVSTDQSYDNQWGVGIHSATATIMGIKVPFVVEIIETPIDRIEIEDITLVKDTNGSYQREYNSNTGEYNEYFHYSYLFNEVKIIYKDGSIEYVSRPEGHDQRFSHFGKIYDFQCSSDQSYENQWGVGDHTVHATINGVETTYTVHIVELPYVSLEILNIAPVMENENTSLVEGKVIYDIPAFSYKVTQSDGTSFVGYYGVEYYDQYGYDYYEHDSLLNVSSDQETNPWTVGGDNCFNVNYAGLEVKVPVQVQVSTPYEYYEDGAEIYITGYKEYVEILKIPSEIAGLPVVGVLGLGNAASTVKELIIPDNVKVIAESVLGNWRDNSILEKITIGSGIKYLDADMFTYCPSLKEITISENNAYYSSFDGVVYDKEGTTLVVYPLGKGNEFTVPAHVDNIDVMFLKYGDVTLEFEEGSQAFIKEDGVLYAADKTKIISCDVDKSGEYIMPDSVTEMTVGAFKDCTELTSVVVSKNVTSIAYCAFYNCTSLTNVELPNMLTTIEKSAFGICTSMTDIELPDSLVTIGERAFECSGLTTIDIPDNVMEIPFCAFVQSDLTEVHFGKNLKKIGNWAFEGTKLETVAVSEKVESIGEYAFYNTPIESITLGSNLKRIENYAFYNTKIKDVTLPNGMEYLGDGAFYGTLIKNITIPDSVTYVGRFGRCMYLESIVIGNGVSVIPNGAFEYCPSLKKVDFRNQVVTVGDYAFYGCPLEEVNKENVSKMGLGAFDTFGMTDVTIPEGVTSVVYYSFRDNATWVNIDVPESLVHIGQNSFDDTVWYDNQEEGLVYLEHILYEYKGTIPEETKLTIKEGTTAIADNAFENETNLKSITLPEGLLTIGKKSFIGCTEMSEIRIPASVNCIDELAFLNSGIASINVDSSNKYYSSVDGVLFNKDGTELLWCPNRNGSSYTIPRNVKYIAPYAFCNSGVTELTVESLYTEFDEKSYGYEAASDALNDKQYNEVKIICYEESLAEVYASKNCITADVKEIPFGWIKEENGWKYLKEDGSYISSGWQLIDESWYYFTNEYRASGWLLLNGQYYYMNPETGIMTTEQWIDNTYYINADGIMVTGWQMIENNYYYFHGNGAKATNQWIGGYYVKSDGVMAINEWIGNYYVNESGLYISITGWFYLNGEYYYLNAGIKQTGWLQDAGTWYYMEPTTGIMCANEWLDDTYYFQANGAMATGWLQMGNGDYHYFSPDGGKVSGQWVGDYYMDQDGILATNEWVGNYYVDGTGAYVAQTGWFYLNGEYYYLIGGAKQSGWLASGATWYYLDPTTGIMYSQEWLDDTYYFYGSGAMATGWVQMENGDYYYFTGSGAKVVSQWIGDYYLGSDGIMATSQWIGRYWVDAAGKWDPNKK